MKIKYNDGQPCEHKGCLNHISHPCEGCGRIGGRGIVYYDDQNRHSINKGVLTMEIKITTLEQLKYWLNQGEVVRMKLIDSEGYIKKEGNNISVITQPRFGKSTTMKSKFKNLDKVFDDLKKCGLYVVRGGELSSRESNFIDKLVDGFRKK